MDSTAHNMIVKAYKVASVNYEGKYLPSGKPFILHHVQIAYTAMKEVGLGHISAVCALLHSLPVIEGEEIYKDISAQFGETVSEILKGFYSIVKGTEKYQRFVFITGVSKFFQGIDIFRFE